jgi:hypothetical protein
VVRRLGSPHTTWASLALSCLDRVTVARAPRDEQASGVAPATRPFGTHTIGGLLAFTFRRRGRGADDDSAFGLRGRGRPGPILGHGLTARGQEGAGSILRGEPRLRLPGGRREIRETVSPSSHSQSTTDGRGVGGTCLHQGRQARRRGRGPNPGFGRAPEPMGRDGERVSRVGSSTRLDSAPGSRSGKRGRIRAAHPERSTTTRGKRGRFRSTDGYPDAAVQDRLRPRRTAAFVTTGTNLRDRPARRPQSASIRGCAATRSSGRTSTTTIASPSAGTPRGFPLDTGPGLDRPARRFPQPRWADTGRRCRPSIEVVPMPIWHPPD